MARMIFFPAETDKEDGYCQCGWFDEISRSHRKISILSNEAPFSRHLLFLSGFGMLSSALIQRLRDNIALRPTD
jgi:hypothetical protein